MNNNSARTIPCFQKDFNFSEVFHLQIFQTWHREMASCTYQLVNGFGKKPVVAAMDLRGRQAVSEVEVSQNFAVWQGFQQQFLGEFFLCVYAADWSAVKDGCYCEDEQKLYSSRFDPHHASKWNYGLCSKETAFPTRHKFQMDLFALLFYLNRSWCECPSSMDFTKPLSVVH